MDELTLAVFDKDDKHGIAALRVLGGRPNEYHRWQTGGEFRQLFVSLCNPSGRVCAGLLAYTHGVWLEFEFVWVAEPLRRRGTALGCSLRPRRRRRRGCRRAYLNTKASPAADFFLTRGFRACGALADYRDGQSRYWLHITPAC